MGLSIHYQGNFKNANSLPLMIEEVVTIAKANCWNYFIFENEFPNKTFTSIPEKENLYGICISPPDCEMVSFSFLSNGKMCGAEKLQFNKHLETLEDDENLYYLHTKTQYAGIEIHKKIIILFDYLSATYFDNFELKDEGQFWETRDEELGQLGIELINAQTDFDKAETHLREMKSRTIGALNGAKNGTIDGQIVVTLSQRAGGAPYLTIKKAK